MNEKDRRKVSASEANAMERCAENLSISEFSRVTGVRIELLRRFINRQVGNIRAETWDKIFPHIRPYLVDPEEPVKNPRIGSTYRRHPELVGMFSDQKVLIDVIDVLPPEKRAEALAILSEGNTPVKPSRYKCLSSEENKLMGAFLALPEDQRDQRLRRLIAIGVEEVKRSRRELLG